MYRYLEQSDRSILQEIRENHQDNEKFPNLKDPVVLKDY